MSPKCFTSNHLPFYDFKRVNTGNNRATAPSAVYLTHTIDMIYLSLFTYVVRLSVHINDFDDISYINHLHTSLERKVFVRDNLLKALLVYRLLETKLDQIGTHFTTDQILETLKVMNVMNFQDTFYASAYTESEVGIALNAAFDLGLNKKYYQPKDLNKKLKNILK